MVLGRDESTNIVEFTFVVTSVVVAKLITVSTTQPVKLTDDEFEVWQGSILCDP